MLQQQQNTAESQRCHTKMKLLKVLTFEYFAPEKSLIYRVFIEV